MLRNVNLNNGAASALGQERENTTGDLRATGNPARVQEEVIRNPMGASQR